nr:MAG TPA: hypothetical protein [Caudoviricetes sp.]
MFSMSDYGFIVDHRMIKSCIRVYLYFFYVKI